jgi:exodeoxyribonuclease-3
MTRFDRLVAAGWTDAWRSLHPDVSEFSWYNAASGNGFRLDHALLSPMLAPRLRTAVHLHTTRTSGATDHSGLLVELNDAGVAPSPPRLRASREDVRP